MVEVFLSWRVCLFLKIKVEQNEVCLLFVIPKQKIEHPYPETSRLSGAFLKL